MFGRVAHVSEVPAIVRAVIFEASRDGRGWSGVRERLLRLMSRGSVRYGEGNLGEIAERLTGGEVDELEAWLGVRLPEDYRRFLIEVSAGGVGPGEGLIRVQRSGDGWDWASEMAQVNRSLVTQPFPTWRADGDTRVVLCGPPPFEERYPDLDEFQTAFDAWAERANAGCGAPERRAGAICIQTFNIVRHDWLIVTGSARGTIWHEWPDHGIDHDMAPGIDANGQALTFTRWYVDWLDALEAPLT